MCRRRHPPKIGICGVAGGLTFDTKLEIGLVFRARTHASEAVAATSELTHV